MLIPVIAICVIVATFFIARYLAARTPIDEEKLNKIIAHKLASNDYMSELTCLREDNGVLRNLVADIVENDTNPRFLAAVSPEEKSRLRTARIKRHRELLAEAVFVLAHSEPSKRTIRSLKIDS